jgi:hypothetical protein
MQNVFRHKPSASLIVAVAALVLAASGTAVAASQLVSGDKLIKQHSLSGNRLRNHTITSKQINMSKLGTVKSATNADHSTTADSATHATTATTATTATNANTANSAPIAQVTYVTQSASISANGVGLVTATCPAGTTVIGGGGQVADELNAFLNDSYPNGKTGWSVNFVNSGGSATNGTTTAICAPAAATAP